MHVLTAHQPVHLPWLGLFHKLALADTFVWFDDVQYQAKEWDNRNRVKTANGTIWLSVPVKRRNHFDIKLREIEIDHSQPWSKKHLKTIRMAYQKAPFFARHISFFEDFYGREWHKLADMNRHFIAWVLDELGLKPRILEMTELALTGTKSDLVLSMCKACGCDVYLFGGEGKSYADVAAFRASGVEPLFQEYRHPVYPQLWGEFAPHLSVLDLLFNCGPASLDVLMADNWTRSDVLSASRVGA